MEEDRIDDVTRLMGFIMYTRMSELYDLVQQAFDRDLIELMVYGDYDDFVKQCALPKDLSYKFHNFIGGAYEELRSWGGMQNMTSVGLGGRSLVEFGNLGRNDACLCDSGKKYKKCCLELPL